MISPLGRADGTLATSYKVVSHVPEGNRESAPIETLPLIFLGKTTNAFEVGPSWLLRVMTNASGVYSLVAYDV